MARASGPGIAVSLSASFSGFELRTNLELAAEGVTALFGPSGSGKTTLLRLLAGLERGKGSLRALGECWQDDARGVFLPAHRRAIGYVFQEASLFPHLSVRENLAYAEKRRRAAAKAPDFQALVELLGISALLGRSPASLSGGERQRVGIARALLVAPRLLLMDEPLAALDEARKLDFFPYLERLRSELSIPIVYVTHSIEEVTRLADALVILERGKVLASGPLQTLLSRLDLPLSAGEHASVVIDAVVGAQDTADALTRVDFAGGSLWVSGIARPLGARVRARVLSRDVSLSLEPPGLSSILNSLPATVVELADQGPDRVNVRLAISSPETPLLARVTRRSRDVLGLMPGKAVYAQVKSVALVA